MKTYKVEILWAAIFMLMTFGWMYLEKFTGLHSTHIDKHMYYTNFVAIPATLVYVFALLDKRKRDFGGKMTWIQGFTSGAIISVILTLVSPLTQYVVHIFITPEYFTNVSKYAVEQGMMKKPEALEYFSLNSYMKQAAVGTLVMGLITSAVVALFVRKS